MQPDHAHDENFVHGSDVTIPAEAETYVTTISNRTIVVDNVKDAAPEPGPAVPVASPDAAAAAVPAASPKPN